MVDVTSQLSTTSYAVLGLLSLRSWTGYELTQQAQRSLALIWPKEDSVLYEEPRRLVARGLARAHKERQGGRTRNRYEITAEGRAALREWLAQPSGVPRHEMEPILRLTFADQGEVSDALAAVATLREWAATNFDNGEVVVRGYQADSGPFPGRLHLSVLCARLYADILTAMVNFADMAEEEIKTWPHTHGLGRTEHTQELIDEMLEIADRKTWATD